MSKWCNKRIHRPMTMLRQGKFQKLVSLKKKGKRKKEKHEVGECIRSAWRGRSAEGFLSFLLPFFFSLFFLMNISAGRRCKLCRPAIPTFKVI